MENLIPVFRKEQVTDLDYCDCCNSYQNSEHIFSYENCYKFCLECAVDRKLMVVNEMAATFGDEPVDFKGINEFIQSSVKKFNGFA
jgi:hypothetical protein